jgi:hypothetical protein
MSSKQRESPVRTKEGAATRKTDMIVLESNSKDLVTQNSDGGGAFSEHIMGEVVRAERTRSREKQRKNDCHSGKYSTIHLSYQLLVKSV